MSHTVDVSADDSAYDLEFRATQDDAWYSVRVILEDETLTVRFLTFPASANDVYNAGDFTTAEAVDDFCKRFRPLSQQLQDSECSRLIEGMTICCSYAFKEDDIRFYDAVVEAVHYEQHSFAKEEEECLCTFVLFWLHGPNEGNLTPASIANICLVISGAQVDPRVSSFVNLAKEKIAMASRKSCSVFEGGVSSCDGVTYDKENCCSPVKQNSSESQYRLQEMDCAGQFSGLDQKFIGRVGTFCEWTDWDWDRDLGGTSVDMNSIDPSGCHRFIVIENLEKDLSPLSIMEFIHKQTSIAPQAYVFPSLSSELYTRGAIMLDCEKKFKKIYDFLVNPNHIIISSRGRPWVITEKIARQGSFRTILGSLMPESQHNFENKNIGDELKVVPSGTKDYWRAKKLSDLVMDFVDHQKRLHRSLALEERKILQPSCTFLK